MGPEEEQIVLTLGMRFGRGGCWVGDGAACVGPPGSWFYPGADLEVGVQHLGQDSVGHHVFLAVCSASHSQRTCGLLF